jgi:ceramide glucosyltransferase
VLWPWFSLPAVILGFLSLRGERKRARFVEESLFGARQGAPSASAPSADLPPATVIVPVKGDDEGLQQNLAALAALDYPEYELIVAARTAGDIPPGVLPRRAKIVLSDGGNPAASEKVQNLTAGVRAASRRSRIFAFADSDGRAPRGWLRALAAPLSTEGVGASTGYRWLTPEPPTFWNLIRSVWNAAIFSTFQPGANAFAWGGAMAMRADVFFQTRVLDCWKDAISDDYALSAAVQAAGLRIAWAPGAMVASTERVRAREFFRWARRQLMITRFYRPGLWWPALLAHTVYCAGMAASIIASIQGNRLAEWAFLAQVSPGMLKGANRATLAKHAVPQFATWFDRYGWTHAWFVPLATWIWLITLVSSAFGGRIVWRGRQYTLKRQTPESDPIAGPPQ